VAENPHNSRPLLLRGYVPLTRCKIHLIFKIEWSPQFGEERLETMKAALISLCVLCTPVPPEVDEYVGKLVKFKNAVVCLNFDVMARVVDTLQVDWRKGNELLAQYSQKSELSNTSCTISNTNVLYVEKRISKFRFKSPEGIISAKVYVASSRGIVTYIMVRKNMSLAQGAGI